MLVGNAERHFIATSLQGITCVQIYRVLTTTGLLSIISTESISRRTFCRRELRSRRCYNIQPNIN